MRACESMRVCFSAYNYVKLHVGHWEFGSGPITPGNFNVLGQQK